MVVLYKVAAAIYSSINEWTLQVGVRLVCRSPAVAVFQVASPAYGDRTGGDAVQ